ncbi:MAG TPA: class F sortase [Cellulomonas sp.]
MTAARTATHHQVPASRLGRRWCVVVALGAAAVLGGCGPAVVAAPPPSGGPTITFVSPSPAPTPPPTPSGPPTVAPLAASAPVRVVVPAIGVDSGLMDLGLNPDGTMQVPPAAFPAGWYTGAPTPGQRGPAIIAGHIDWGSVHGVFHDLAALRAGDVVTVTRADASVVTFRVTDVEEYPKDKFPTAAVYGDTADPELRLITCGGDFDKGTGHYVDNVVAYAVMEPTPPAA